MVSIKKLAFAPLLIISFLILLYFFNPLLKSADLIFSLDLNTFTQLVTLSLLGLISSLIFVLIALLVSDLKLIIPIIILVSTLPFILIEAKLAIILSVIILISLLLTYVSLENKLRNYLTFSATNLLSPSIRQLCSLLILGLCLIYYLSINNVIQQQGFQIPDSLIDAALKFNPQVSFPVPQLTPDQPSTTDMDSFLKQAVKEQIQSIIKPYKDFIPAVLAVLLFFTLQSFIAILSLSLAPLLWLIFLVLEKTNFIHYETEMREAKKLVV